MKIFLIPLLLIVPPAQAATYTLSGSNMSCDSPGEFCDLLNGHSFDGSIRIKGQRVGGLANRDLWWGVGETSSLPAVPLQRIGTIRLDLPAPFGSSLDGLFKSPFVYSRFHLVTGRFGRVRRWSLEIVNDPPNFLFTNRGLSVWLLDSFLSGPRGTLTRGPAPVPSPGSPPPVAEAPIPAAGLLLMGGMGALAWVRSRRRLVKE